MMNLPLGMTKKRMLPSDDLRIDSMNDTFNSFWTVTNRTISFLSTTPTNELAHKDQLERKEKELQKELDTYKQKISEFSCARPATIEKMNMDINSPPGGGTFVMPRPRETVIKYAARHDLQPDVLQEEATIEYFLLWEEVIINCFSELYQQKGTKSQI